MSNFYSVLAGEVPFELRWEVSVHLPWSPLAGVVNLIAVEAAVGWSGLVVEEGWFAPDR
jgi:hypothetical protein